MRVDTGTINDGARLDVSPVCHHRSKSPDAIVISVRLNASH